MSNCFLQKVSKMSAESRLGFLIPHELRGSREFRELRLIVCETRLRAANYLTYALHNSLRFRNVVFTRPINRRRNLCQNRVFIRFYILNSRLYSGVSVN